jgi:hypothetical protein
MEVTNLDTQTGVTTVTLEDNPMRNKHRQLKLNVKGNAKKWWGEHLLKLRASRAGVDVREVNHPSAQKVEIIAAGEMNKLWKIINWSKRGSLFFAMNEVLVEFVD